MRPFVMALAALTFVAGTSRLASAGNFTFNFPDTLLNTATPFSMTNNGVTVSFSSPADPGGFVVYPSFFSFNNNVLS